MYLGIDIGSSSIKVLAFDNGCSYKASADYPAGTGMMEQDASAVRQTVAEAVKKLFSGQPVSPGSIAGIGLCGHGPSIVFADRQGHAVTPIVTWQDRRACDEAAMLRRLWPGFEKDGTSFEAKLIWYFNHQRDVFREGLTALYPKDYLLGLLCGRVCMDCSTASAIVYYDRDALKWNTHGLCPEYVLPEVVPAWEQAGVTGTEFSRSCGFPDGIPVYPGGIDCFCEAVGSGGVQGSVVVDGSGTSTCLTRVVPRTPEASWHVLPDAALQINMLSSTGASYQWFRTHMASETAADAMLAQIDPEKPVNLLYLPYLSGERCPIWDEAARGTFVGLDTGTTRPQMLQALLQGVGFAVRQNLEQMGGEITALHAVGGGNRSDVWLQIKADICGIPYRKLREQDASALGAALVAAVGSGAYTTTEAADLIQVEKEFTPRKELRAFYDRLYQSYTEAYPALRSIYHRMLKP